MSQKATMAMDWQPNQDFFNSLVEMGMSTFATEKALYYTGNTSVEAAAAWIVDHSSDPDLNEPLMIRNRHASIRDSLGSIDEAGAVEVKMVFIVNDAVGMGRGKIASQVAHAAIGLYETIMKNREKYGGMLSEWEQFGCTKIVLKGASAPQLMDFEEEARMNGIPKFLVCDAGKTQVAPATVTVLGLFGYASSLRPFVGDLPLLS